MTYKRRQLHQLKHPFNSYPFEAFIFGSWQAVESIKIESGTTVMQCINNLHMTMEKCSSADIRIRSRKATTLDCSCVLRPGIDVCVLSSRQPLENSDKSTLQPVWADAKISSVQRKPHESECSCQFYVNFYVNQGSPGAEQRTISKEVKVVGIDQISILQRLQPNPCEDHHRYRWASPEDCPAIPQTRLLVGKFLSDLSWMVVTSVLKKVSFCVRCVANKLFYQILGSDTVGPSLNTESCININVVNFRVDDGILVPIVYQVVTLNMNWADYAHVSLEDEVSSSYDVEGLRRSKRRNVQPERYLGCNPVSEFDVGYVRTRPSKIDMGKNDKMSQALSCLFGLHGNRPEKDVGSSEKANKMKRPTELPAKSDDAEKSDDFSGRCDYSYATSKLQRKSLCDLEDMDLATGWERTHANKGIKGKKYRSSSSRSRNFEAERTSRDKTLNAAAYKELIDSYLRNINARLNKEELPVTDQWKQFQESSSLGQKRELAISYKKNEGGNMDELWRELDMGLASSHVMEDTEGNATCFAETPAKSNEACQHDKKFDEELGYFCLKCGSVVTEIKHVFPTFIEEDPVWHRERQCRGENSDPKADEDDDSQLLLTHVSPDEPIFEENDNVWKLIPELGKKMHLHQKSAFEFLWQNIAGSTEPALMEAESKKRGGCVISHSPGAGKTFLIIAFLVSYLKLFPGKRPLVLAPKTTLYTWHKEFSKWEIPLPVYLIHCRKTYRGSIQETSVVSPGVPKPTEDVKHVLDCLEKIQKWQSHPSVLVMGYTSFLTMMRENSKFAHRKCMAKVLRESPGLLVLDEGHNPRSTKSKLRKVLMKVQTELRILLSGTLFQNNFCEYFNTLCLARPKFVHEILEELDPKYRREKKGSEKARHLIEARARKFFLDKIAKKIDSSIGGERMRGLNLLRNVTNGFIDVYEGGGSDNLLPGLQIYTLLMNTTDIQHEILKKLHKKMAKCNGYALELELLITLGSIHPWLVKTVACAQKFFTLEELNELEKCKFDLKIGSKVRFVLSLIYRVVKEEKVLIFCHNIAPLKLFVEYFDKYFGWQKGREVLVLTGDLELFERGRVMDKFEETGGESKILLASITACAEGISLTAASRVVLLDSEWNPSKTKQAIARAFRPGQQKVVYVYQLLVTGSLEEDKYRRTTWKEWVSSMIFSEAFVEDPAQWQAEKIEDDILREMVEEDRAKSFHMIMKNEKASIN